MRQVDRTKIPIPKSIENNGKKWTKELLGAIAKAKKSRTKIPKAFYNKYKKNDILNALKDMYGDNGDSYCCYCESTINTVSYEEIEHRKPKSKYPRETFDWNNLHLACSRCNKHKGDKYNNKFPILDAAIDNIEQNLGYKHTPKGVLRETLTQRGITTVEDTDLDREPLPKKRQTIWIKTQSLIDDIKRLGNDPRVYTAKKALRYECKGEYGSLIKHLMIKEGIWI